MKKDLTKQRKCDKVKVSKIVAGLIKNRAGCLIPKHNHSRKERTRIVMANEKKKNSVPENNVASEKLLTLIPGQICWLRPNNYRQDYGSVNDAKNKELRGSLAATLWNEDKIIAGYDGPKADYDSYKAQLQSMYEYIEMLASISPGKGADGADNTRQVLRAKFLKRAFQANYMIDGKIPDCVKAANGAFCRGSFPENIDYKTNPGETVFPILLLAAADRLEMLELGQQKAQKGSKAGIGSNVILTPGETEEEFKARKALAENPDLTFRIKVRPHTYATDFDRKKAQMAQNLADDAGLRPNTEVDVLSGAYELVKGAIIPETLTIPTNVREAIRGKTGALCPGSKGQKAEYFAILAHTFPRLNLLRRATDPSLAPVKADKDGNNGKEADPLWIPASKMYHYKGGDAEDSQNLSLLLNRVRATVKQKKFPGLLTQEEKAILESKGKADEKDVDQWMRNLQFIARKKAGEGEEGEEGQTLEDYKTGIVLVTMVRSAASTGDFSAVAKYEAFASRINDFMAEIDKEIEASSSSPPKEVKEESRELETANA